MNKKINFVFKNTDTDSIIVSDKVIDYRIIHGPRFCSLYNTMNSLGLAKKHSEDLLPNEPFFYEYEWPWWFKIEDFFGESGFLENNSIPSNVLLRIKEKTAYLVLTIPMESCVFPHHLKIIHSYFEKVNLPHTQILYFNCSPNGNELYQQFCSSNNVDPKFISKYAPVYLNTYRHFVDSEYYQKSIDYKVEHKQKDFLMFNRRWGNHPQRVLFFYFFHKLNLTDKMYISFSKTEIDNGGSYKEHLERFSHYLDNFTLDSNVVDEIENLLPITLDVDDLSQDLMFTKMSTTDFLYKNSFINLTAETYFFSDVIHITEKTFKPILYLQPFIIISTPYFLQHIKNLGFKTFSEIWDESYDIEENHTLRFMKILDLITELTNKDQSEKLMIAKKCKPIIEYNINHLRNLHNNVYIQRLVNDYGIA